jgi:hypothetical protein
LEPAKLYIMSTLPIKPTIDTFFKSDYKQRIWNIRFVTEDVLFNMTPYSEKWLWNDEDQVVWSSNTPFSEITLLYGYFNWFCVSMRERIQFWCQCNSTTPLKSVISDNGVFEVQTTRSSSFRIRCQIKEDIFGNKPYILDSLFIVTLEKSIDLKKRISYFLG